MKTCATCKHWTKSGWDGERNEKFPKPTIKLGACAAVPMFWASTKWADDGMSREYTERGNMATAFAQDGSDYEAYLLTKPEHGCTMHEDATK